MTHSSFRSTSHRTPSLTKGRDRAIAGVCAGIAERLDADAVVVRVTAIVLALCTAGLVIIPYIVLAIVLPAPQAEDEPVDVDPLAITSDRYRHVANVSGGRSASDDYGVRADSGHRPPRPPEAAARPVGGDLHATPPHPTERDRRRSALRIRGIVVFALAAAFTVLFAVAAYLFVSNVPGVRFSGFWPLFFLVAGMVVLVCPTEELTLGVRLCGLVLCAEICLILLPFTLGICPISSLDRLSDVSIIMWFAVALCLLAAIIFHRGNLLALSIGLLAVTIAVTFVEIGAVERLMAFSSYMHHNSSVPFFRR